MASAILVALVHELDHVLVCWRERQVLCKNGFDILSGNDLTITLVEKFIALLGFFIFATLSTDSPIPMEGDDVAHKGKVHGVTLQVIIVTLSKLLLDVARAHLVEAEVLQDVAEEVLWDG